MLVRLLAMSLWLTVYYHILPSIVYMLCNGQIMSQEAQENRHITYNCFLFLVSLGHLGVILGLYVDVFDVVCLFMVVSLFYLVILSCFLSVVMLLSIVFCVFVVVLHLINSSSALCLGH